MIKTGCRNVFEDKLCGARADRPGLTKTLEMLSVGDILIVRKLDMQMVGFDCATGGIDGIYIFVLAGVGKILA